MTPKAPSVPAALVLLAGLLAALLAAAGAPAQATPRTSADRPRPAEDRPRPNVLLILADDLGYSDLGSFGGEIPTPNLDRLARGGLRFTQCYNSARCCPSRAALLTGLYPHQAAGGVFATREPHPGPGPANQGRLTERSATLAEVLKGAGYSTWMVGKWHVGDPGPVARGFDEFYGFVHGYEQDQWQPERYQRLPEGPAPQRTDPDGAFYATDAFSDQALAFVAAARRQARPWFVYLAHSAPHFPVQAPRATVDKHVATYRRGWDVLRAERFGRMRGLGLADSSWSLTDRAMVPVDRPDIANGFPGRPNPAWDELPSERREDLARRMAVFAAMVEHVDRGVGRLLDDLVAHGELENTVVLFLSDNGACYEWGPFGFDGPSRRGETVLHEGAALAAMGGPGTYHSYGSGWANLCNTPLRLYKHYAHEGGICTPLLVHWPAGIAAPDRWVRDPVHVIDLMPTLCELAGADYPDERAGVPVPPMEGVSLVPALRGQPLPERTLAFEHDGARAIRQGRFKAVWSKRMPYEIEWELYDLDADRCEAVDLAAEQPERTRELAELWEAWARRVGVHPFAAEGDRPPTPRVAGRALTIRCTVRTRGGDGVILAHGGRRQGYALHLDRGQVVFSVRRNGELTEVRGPAVPPGTFRVVAGLDDGSLRVAVDGGTAVQRPGPGLLPEEPVDGLSLGRDDRTAVGGYAAPHALDGAVTDVVIDVR